MTWALEEDEVGKIKVTSIAVNSGEQETLLCAGKGGGENARAFQDVLRKNGGS